VLRRPWLNAELNGKRYIPYGALEGGVLDYTKKIFEIQKELGVNTPIVRAYPGQQREMIDCRLLEVWVRTRNTTTKK
jgi:hypothetical protein